MKSLRVGLAVLACVLALNQRAFSQLVTQDVNVAASVVAAQQQYAHSFVSPPQLFSGPEYLDYSKRYHLSEGHQFFETPEKQAGSVYYNNHRFAGLRLGYDIVLDQVLISPPSSPLTLRLINEKVRTFTVNGHRFDRLVADSATSKVIRTGYYEVLLDSTVRVLAKHSKRLQEHLVQSNLNVQFTQTDKLFIYKAGTYYPVNKKGAAMRAFADRGKEMQAYLKDHKLSFGKTQLAPTVVELARYYRSLPAH
ncbi:MAG: hypothetical protein JWR44_2601 [Hymenobacter sp.]|jgi:hypothetical protein|nr:hypothetical protein [Hymenobacter sp.]